MWCASTTSSALFIIVAESTVIRGPMSQVGWASASSTVTAAMSAAARPRNGPPEAVRTSRATDPGCSPTRHCQMAECSESTGMISPPPSAAAASTSSPPATRVSLLASASRLPAARAASDGLSPAHPTTPLTTTAPGVAARASTASTPWPSREPRSGGTCSEPAGSAVTTRASGYRVATSTRAGDRRRAARPTTVNPSRSATSSTWVPIEPVAPSTTTGASVRSATPSIGRSPTPPGPRRSGRRPGRGCRHGRAGPSPCP